MRKTIAIILTMLIILNLYSPISSATSIGETESLQQESAGQSLENYNSIMEEGTVTNNGDGGPSTAELKLNSSWLNSATSVLQSILLIIPILANNILSFIVYGNMSEVFTIQKLLSNEYAIFDVNFFKTEVDDSVQYADTINTIKQSVAMWYVSIRNISAVVIAIILVYIGIRMAISTVADSKAKYKKMLVFWLESVVLLFLLHFFVLIALNIADTINGMMIKVMQNIEGKVGIEEELLDNVKTNLNSVDGPLNTLIYIITYIMLVYYELKFFIMYFTRVLRIGFYIVIAPLVCVTYPIDRLGDGRAQAFKNWLTEITMEIFLQSIHLGLYIVFIFSAGEIIRQAPLLGVVFLAALGRGEKIVRDILKIRPKFAKGVSETKLPKYR